jgi:hypothetical protein
VTFPTCRSTCVLLNPLPTYGLAMGMLALVVALFSKSRPAGRALPRLVRERSRRRAGGYFERGFDRVVAVR